MTAASLEITGLCAGYGPTRIIQDLDLSVPAGGRLAVLGRNGMGKTTLFATIAGQTRQTGGRIRLDGRDITRLDGPARAMAGLGYVPQHRAIFPSLTVEENLLAGLKSRPRSDLSQAYDLFPRLGERRRNPGASLSGGEQQMLSIARAILGQPRLLLLDEPLEGLAPVICDELMAGLSELAACGTMTLVLIEQRIRAALDFAELVAIMERGAIAWSGSSASLSAEPSIVARLLGVGQ